MTHLPPDRTDPALVVIDEVCMLSFEEMCNACDCAAQVLQDLVDEGVLQPHGAEARLWHFRGPSLGRARRALRLMRDLELNPPAVALVLDLLDENAALRARLAAAPRSQR